MFLFTYLLKLSVVLYVIMGPRVYSAMVFVHIYRIPTRLQGEQHTYHDYFFSQRATSFPPRQRVTTD